MCLDSILMFMILLYVFDCGFLYICLQVTGSNIIVISSVTQEWFAAL